MDAHSYTANPGAPGLVRELAELAEKWSDLGVWCTFWNDAGQPIYAVPKSGGFWGSLWNQGQRLRNELARAVIARDEQTTRTLLDIEGLEVHLQPVDRSRRAGIRALTVCIIRDHCRWTEEFTRLCSQLQVDEQIMRTWFEKQPRYSRDQAGGVVALLGQSLGIIENVATGQAEVNEMTLQLADAYEELNLIYRVGAMMRVTQQPKDYFAQLFADLTKTTSFTTVAAVLYDTEVLDPDNRLIIGGEPLVDEPGVLKIADALLPTIKKSRNALIINHPDEFPKLDWARHWLTRAIAVPIICNQTMMGVVLVFNHSRDVDFNSTDARLLHSVMDRSAIYLENVFLYGDLNKLLMGLMHALVSSIDAKDPYTCGHSNRVAVVSQRLAEKAGLSPLRAERVYLGGLLHDIGKIGISESILCKSGLLTEAETQEMRRHPQIGAKILSGITQLNDVIPAVLHHHEWLKGTGYPDGLSGNDIPWIAKVVGLADAFDAMTTGRKYREAFPLASAMAEIRRFAGTQFCPKLVDGLVELVSEGLADRLKTIRNAPSFGAVQTHWVRKIEAIP